MYKGKRFSFKGNSAIAFLICLGVSLAAVILLSAIFAFVANISRDPTGNLGIYSLAALLLGGAVGGFASAKINKERALLSSALVALAVTAIMLIVCVIIGGKVGGGAFMNYACYVGVSAFSGFLGTREKKHRRRAR